MNNLVIVGLKEEDDNEDVMAVTIAPCLPPNLGLIM